MYTMNCYRKHTIKLSVNNTISVYPDQSMTLSCSSSCYINNFFTTIRFPYYRKMAKRKREEEGGSEEEDLWPVDNLSLPERRAL